MPIYEYTCRACGQSFEKRLKVEERQQTQTCPECGHIEAEFRMSIPAPVAIGARTARQDVGYCPSTGQACGCANAIRN